MRCTSTVIRSIAAIAAANVIGTPTDSILPRRCGSCAVLLNNRERPLIWKAVIAGRERSCKNALIFCHAVDKWSSSFLLDGQAGIYFQCNEPLHRMNN